MDHKRVTTTSPAGTQPHRILVVDDDVDIRYLNTEALVQFGYEVDSAEDGEAAWLALNRDCYDLLVTDNNMPRVSGVELLKKLHHAHMALPIIMATSALPQEFARAPWLQPAAMLLKPYTLTELVGTVKEVLRASTVARESITPTKWQDAPQNGREHGWRTAVLAQAWLL